MIFGKRSFRENVRVRKWLKNSLFGF